MTYRISLFIEGTARPKGSKIVQPRRGWPAFSPADIILREDSKVYKHEQLLVKHFKKEVERIGFTPFRKMKARVLSLIFTFEKPKRSDLSLEHHLKPPDIDKLLRTVFDALTKANVVYDDSNITELNKLQKRFCEADEIPGTYIELEVQNLEETNSAPSEKCRSDSGGSVVSRKRTRTRKTRRVSVQSTKS